MSFERALIFYREAGQAQSLVPSWLALHQYLAALHRLHGLSSVSSLPPGISQFTQAPKDKAGGCFAGGTPKRAMGRMASTCIMAARRGLGRLRGKATWDLGALRRHCSIPPYPFV